MFSQQHKLLAAAVIASLALSACGKKKDIYAPPEAPPVASGDQNPGGGLPPAPDLNTPPGGQEPQAPGHGPTEPDDFDDNVTPQLPPEPGKGGGKKPDRPSRPAPTPIEDDFTDDDLGGGSPIDNDDDSNPPPTPQRPVPPGKDAQPEPQEPTGNASDYNPTNGKSLDIQDIEKRLTGGASADGLLYTSSSTDTIHEFLKARSTRVNAESRRLNGEAANSVQSASLTKSGGIWTVSIRVQEGESVVLYQLAGRAGGPKGEVLRVTGASKGTRPVDGTLACLDADGGCETTFARLRLGETGSSGIINIIFRDTESDLHFKLPKERSGSADYETIREVILNTTKGARTDSKFVEARMTSWEVTGGRSGVALSMTAANGEYMGYSVPLVARSEGTYVIAPATKIANSQGRKYAEMIEDARLIANNGLGQVRLALKMKARAGSGQDTFQVTFMRVMKPLIELSEEKFK